MTRLFTEGEIIIGNVIYQTSGLSWMDHEFSTSALTKEQIGWDWFSLQFDDGNELMLFQIRKQDGSIDLFSSGTWIADNDETVSLGRDDFFIQVLDHWKSNKSGGDYPSRWLLKVDNLKLELNLEPLISDQEMNLLYTYWEGAVRVTGKRNGLSVSGFGYVELTGYSGTMAGEF